MGGCMVFDGVGMLKEVSELKRRCIEMRFLLAAGVFELATISHEVYQLLFEGPTLFSTGCVCLSS
jgi:hypothetical protein